MASNGAASGQPERAVATTHEDVVVADGSQPGPGLVGQVLVPLDGPDLRRHPTEHGGAVAGARADLEHPVSRPSSAASAIAATM